MNKKPRVSVIVNCFNGEKFLKKSLDSVLNQTYKDWELIFWDNQSNDNSVKIFKSYKDKRFKYFYAPKHTVLYKARGEAISKSSGEILAFLDVDDWWNEDKLERQIPLFQDDKVGLVYSNFYLFYETSKKKKIFNKKNYKSGYIFKNLLKRYNIGILTVLIRKTAYNSTSGFNNQLRFSGDFDLIVRLSSKWKFNFIQKPMAYYRIHGDNFYNKYNANNEIEIEELEKWILSKEITSDENLKPYLYYIKHRIIFLKTIRYINKGELKKAIKSLILLPLGVTKIKLILHIVLPKIIIKKFKRL